MGRPKGRMLGYGTERYTSELCSAISSGGGEVDFAGDWAPAMRMTSRMPPYGAKLSAILYDAIFPFFFMLRRSTRRADVIHLVDLANAFPGVILGRLTNRRIVVTIQSMENIAYERGPTERSFWESIYRVYYLMSLRISVSWATCLIAVSDLVAKDLARLYPNSRVAVIPPSVSPGSNEPRSWEDIINLGFVGALIGRKRATIAITVLAALKRRGLNSRLFVVGSGPQLPELSSIAASLELSADVKFLGHVSKSLDTYYRRFDFLIFPTRVESFGFPIVEAARFGVPSIVLSDALLPENTKSLAVAVESPEAAADLIESLRSNRESYYTLRERTVRSAATFSRVVIWGKLSRLYAACQDPRAIPSTLHIDDIK